MPPLNAAWHYSGEEVGTVVHEGVSYLCPRRDTPTSEMAVNS
jgi:hypothetical protein